MRFDVATVAISCLLLATACGCLLVLSFLGSTFVTAASIAAFVFISGATSAAASATTAALFLWAKKHGKISL